MNKYQIITLRLSNKKIIKKWTIYYNYLFNSTMTIFLLLTCRLYRTYLRLLLWNRFIWFQMCSLINMEEPVLESPTLSHILPVHIHHN